MLAQSWCSILNSPARAERWKTMRDLTAVGSCRRVTWKSWQEMSGSERQAAADGTSRSSENSARSPSPSEARDNATSSRAMFLARASHRAAFFSETGQRAVELAWVKWSMPSGRTGWGLRRSPAKISSAALLRASMALPCRAGRKLRPPTLTALSAYTRWSCRTHHAITEKNPNALT
jgi:hypothetical protein